MTHTPTDDLKSRTYDFMNALAASSVDAVNISYGDTGVGTVVHTWLHDDGVAPAEELAAEHDFELFGEASTALNEANNQYAAEQGRKRIRFETRTDK